MKSNVMNQTLFAVLISLSVACVCGAAQEQDLLAVLHSNAGAVEKCAACQQLRICGTVQSVAALASVLGDERVSHAARYALESMPYPEAGSALRDALGKTSGAVKAGLIDSIGRRGDRAAAPLLVPLLRDADKTIAATTASALGWIGDNVAAAALAAACDDPNPEVRKAVLDALLRCGEMRLAQGDKSAAAGIYRRVLEVESPSAIRIAAWRGAVLSDDGQRAKLVVAALTGQDKPLRLMAARLVQETKDDGLLKACLKQWKSLNADAQVLVVNVLADRGDKASLADVVTACASSEKAVRIAAIKAVGVLDDGANVALLADRAAQASGDEQAAARDGLRSLHGRNVHDEMIALVKKADPAVRIELIQALADRRATEATAALLLTARSDQASVRSASYRALRDLAGAGDVGALVAMLIDAKGGEQKPLENTILGVARRANAGAETSKAVLAKLDSVRDTQLKGIMIGILGQLGDASALPTLRKALGDADREVRYAAIAGLGRWPNAEPLSDLLRIAGDKTDANCQIRALGAYIDLVGGIASMPADEKVRCYKTAMDLSPNAAGKKRVLGTLANVKTLESMQLAASHVRDEDVREEAALSTVTVAEAVYGGNAKAVEPILEGILAANVANATKERAKRTLDEIKAVSSYLTSWEVAGPYAEKDKNYSQLFDIAFDPEKPNAQVAWRKMPVSRYEQHPAYLDLLKELDGGEQKVAYVRTRIESTANKPVMLEIFSDDGVKAWLNGKVIHSNNTARPILAEPDRVTATLNQGVNTLMLKITQNNLPWGAIVRVKEAKTAEPKVGDGWRLHVINADSRFEAAGVLDVNRDGKLDILSGGLWYEAPDWKKHFVREIKEEGNYFYDFANLPMDVDGDGWVDTAGAAWHNKMVYWVRNPGKTGEPWQVFEVDTPGNMETAMAYDIDGDGQLDILPNIMSEAAWYGFTRDASAPQGVKWQKHPLPKEAAGHGLGAGDVNKDGRCDVVTPKGWLEQNADGGWLWRPEFELGYAGIPILVHDVDGDGDSDLIWGLGHNYGLYWLEQKNADGKRTWEKHLIDDSWSQPHFMLMADLDNDGRDELVTGKRYYAHNGNDPGGNDPRCVYYYDFDATAKKWARHVLHEGGTVGFGINTMAVDIDADGDIDVVAPGKSGLYLLENLLK
ncbi:MAG TPA: HEAT repeat domain-containing protein [Sedimentisphaerales bacterium]|nr:HEAT repeat domain-containing protein [Sedimentisphaerales bacterium]